MDAVMESAILKAVSRKFPVCNVLDSRSFTGGDISVKCGEAPRNIKIKLGKVMYDVTICTGSFNVYVLDMKEEAV
jgi:hypothetical protein